MNVMHFLEEVVKYVLGFNP